MISVFLLLGILKIIIYLIYVDDSLDVFLSFLYMVLQNMPSDMNSTTCEIQCTIPPIISATYFMYKLQTGPQTDKPVLLKKQKIVVHLF